MLIHRNDKNKCINRNKKKSTHINRTLMCFSRIDAKSLWTEAPLRLKNTFSKNLWKSREKLMELAMQLVSNDIMVQGKKIKI